MNLRLCLPDLKEYSQESAAISTSPCLSLWYLQASHRSHLVFFRLILVNVMEIGWERISRMTLISFVLQRCSILFHLQPCQRSRVQLQRLPSTQSSPLQQLLLPRPRNQCQDCAYQQICLLQLYTRDWKNDSWLSPRSQWTLHLARATQFHYPQSYISHISQTWHFGEHSLPQE